jgi:Spy/CpxP family protein refolding chaperone
MRKTVRLFVLLTCIASATAFGSQIVLAADAETTSAQTQGYHHRHHRRGNSFRKSLKKLGLTDQQKAQVKAIFTANKAQTKPLFVSLLTAKNGLKMLIQSGTADASTINAQSATIATAQANLALLRALEYTQFLAVLTPAQLTTLNSIQAAQQAKFQKFIMAITNAS